MQYNLQIEFQRKAFLARVETMLEKADVVELTRKSFRPQSQNGYLHILLGVVALATGNRVEDVKREYFKALVNPDIFVQRKPDNLGNTITVYRSCRDVSAGELATAIDRFQAWGASNGIYVPRPEEEGDLRAIALELGRMKNYLE